MLSAEGRPGALPDGSSETNLDAVAHSFVEFGEKTVSVSVRCSVCGKTETAERNERRANERVNRKRGDILEAEDLNNEKPQVQL